jgi:hypothetical protein
MTKEADASITESLAKAGLDDIARKPRGALAAIDYSDADKAKLDQMLQLLMFKLTACAERMGDEIADVSLHMRCGTVTGMAELSFRAYRRQARVIPEKAH